MLPKVWCIGVPRTGTTTFLAALHILGYVKTAHNPFFDELKKVDAASDSGCAAFYKYLYYRFPDSKFVLTTRSLESWLPSMQYLAEQYKGLWADYVKKNPSRYEEWVLRRSLMFGMGEFEPKRVAKEFNRHYREVREFFADKPDVLLEMNITEGDSWEKLCPFLGIPIPPVPFPCAHTLIRPK